jgi:hypothetical protein
LPQILQTGTGKTPLKVAFLNVLDHVPTDSKMASHVLDRVLPASVKNL